MLHVVLNTQTYLGGSAFTTEGSEYYQIPRWKKHAKVTSINFFRDVGDAGRIELCLHEKVGGDPVYVEQIPFRANYHVENVEIHSDKERLYMTLRALDGGDENHAKIVVRGEEIEPSS